MGAYWDLDLVVWQCHAVWVVPDHLDVGVHPSVANNAIYTVLYTFVHVCMVIIILMAIHACSTLIFLLSLYSFFTGTGI